MLVRELVDGAVVLFATADGFRDAPPVVRVNATVSAVLNTFDQPRTATTVVERLCVHHDDADDAAAAIAELRRIVDDVIAELRSRGWVRQC